MKKTLQAAFIITSMMAGLSLQAQEVLLPQVGVPAVLQEGIQRELSAAQIAELLPWAKDSKIFLQDLMDQVQSLPMEQKIERLIDGIKQVVVESAPKHSELIMRYSLNRALVVIDILNQETQEGVVGSVDAKARVLMASIRLALKYYDSDLANLSSKVALPYASFGLEYFNFLHELNKSIFDASAQYNIQRTALEFLQWDLYRDLNNATFAPQIVKINNALKIFPQKKMPDAHALNYIRQMKKTVEQLGLGQKIEKEKQSILAAQEAQRPAVVVKKGKFKTYDGKCYAADTAGNILWDAGAMDWRQCHNGNFRAYDGKCYATDKDNSILWSAGKMEWKSCHNGKYRTYDGKCFATDSSNSILWDAGKVQPSLCHSGSYRTYDGACYATDANNAVIWDLGKVSYTNCQ